MGVRSTFWVNGKPVCYHIITDILVGHFWVHRIRCTPGYNLETVSVQVQVNCTCTLPHGLELWFHGTVATYLVTIGILVGDIGTAVHLDLHASQLKQTSRLLSGLE